MPFIPRQNLLIKILIPNFIFGINAQICFVDRIKVSYQTTDVIPAESQSSGWVNFRSTSVGLHLGYLFLKGKTINQK
jgi:hypothetical protein